MILSSDDLALDAALARPHAKLTCQFGMQQSTSHIEDPYYGQSQGTAQRLGRTQLRPLLDYFGFGPQAGTRRAGQFEDKLAGATGPLAEYIRQTKGFIPQVYGQSQDIGNQIAGQGQQAYNTFQGALQPALADLGTYGQSGMRANQLAGRYAERAANPLADEDLYQVAQQRVMSQLRPSLAARGLEGSSGAGAQAQADVIRNLATDFAGQRRSDQYNSLQALQQAAGTGAQLAAMRPQLAGQGMDAVNGLAQMLQQRYGIPMQAMGGILQMLTAGQQPSLALTQATAPQVAQGSSGWRIL